MSFHARLFPGVDFASKDGLYLGRPYHAFKLCTDAAPCRLSESEKKVRSLSGYSLLEATWGSQPPAWL